MRRPLVRNCLRLEFAERRTVPASDLLMPLGQHVGLSFERVDLDPDGTIIRIEEAPSEQVDLSASLRRFVEKLESAQIDLGLIQRARGRVGISTDVQLYGEPCALELERDVLRRLVELGADWDLEQYDYREFDAAGGLIQPSDDKS